MADVILGLDLDVTNMKLALVKQDKHVSILTTKIIQNPDMIDADGELAHVGKISELLKEYIGNLDIKPKSIAICINSPNIITRKIVLPFMNNLEIGAAVRFEVLTLFPSVKESHMIAHKIIESDEKSITVFVALCPFSLLNDYEKIEQLVGVPVQFIGTHADAQCKAIEKFFDTELIGAQLIIDIQNRSSLVNVVKNGKVFLSRYVTSGVEGFDSLVAEKAGVKQKDIEKARRCEDFSQIPINLTDLEIVKGQCFSEIENQARQTIELYDYEKQTESIRKVSVVGEGSGVPEVESYFASALGLSVGKLISLPEFSNLPNMKILIGAIGITLCAFDKDTDVNFLKNTTKHGKTRRKWDRLMFASAAAIAILAISVIISGWFYVSRLLDEGKITDIQNEIEKNSAVLILDQEMSVVKKELAEIEGVVEAIEQKSVNASKILETLTMNAPENLFAVNCSILNEQEMVISGKSKDYESITNYVHFLRSNGTFASISINTITTNKSSSDDIIDYSFSMTLQPKDSKEL